VSGWLVVMHSICTTFVVIVTLKAKSNPDPTGRVGKHSRDQNALPN